MGVGMRTLQRCFASYFQVSPTDYIKARRLNRARRRLVAADSSSRRVTDIAIQFGLTHMGRFSVEYRSLFGESPREILRTGVDK
jgi:transcriptional regulator GlxA family with amidase domain